MKGKLNKINGKWFVEYSTSSYSGGNPKQLGSYTKKVEQKRLELTPNNQRYMNCFLYVDKDTRVDFKEVLINPMGREVDHTNLGQNHSGCIWYAELTYDEDGVKDEQKQHLINMMESDEELGLYDENSPGYNHQARLVNDLAKELKLEEVRGSNHCLYSVIENKLAILYRNQEKILESIKMLNNEENRTEIKFEDVFNDEKREGVKRVIHQHKVLQSLSLVNPSHLQMTSNGRGEFPDGYKLTEKGIQYIIEQLNKE